MRLLKWLFQPAYVLLIIVVVALYVNREAVFPEKVAESLEAEALVARVEGLAERLRSDSEDEVATAEQDEAVALVDAPVQADVATVVERSMPTEVATAKPVIVAAPSEEPVPATAGTDVNSESADSNAVAVTSIAVEAPESDVIVTDDATITSQDTDLIATVEPELAQTQPSVTTTPDTLIAPQPTDTTSLAVEQQPVTPDAGALSPLAHWKAARAAVWQGDLDGALSHYRKLIASQPDNYDAYGEMGNVLLAQSNAQAAADAYATAASLIYRAGNREMAYRVANIVAELDRARGQALQGEFARQ